MALRGEGMDNDDGAGEGNAAQGGRIVYVLHPNCAIEEV
jgi:DNA replication licensing factor MCM6